MIDWNSGFIKDQPWYEIAPELIAIPFLSADLCSQIVSHGEQQAERFKPYGPDVTNNAAPGQEMRLNLFDPHGINPWKQAVEQLIYPVIKTYWWPLTLGKMRMPFVIRYDPDIQAHLDPHHDASQVSITIPLTNSHEGGDLIFPRQHVTINREFPAGHALLFPGRVTSVHYVKPVTAGIRYSLVQWLTSRSETYDDQL